MDEALDTASLCRGFNMAAPPPGFVDDPYPTYAALRRHSPVQPMSPGSFLPTCREDMLATFRSPHLSGDKLRQAARICAAPE